MTNDTKDFVKLLDQSKSSFSEAYKRPISAKSYIDSYLQLSLVYNEDVSFSNVLSSLALESFDCHTEYYVEFDMLLYLTEKNDKIDCILEYSTELFKHETAIFFSKKFLELVKKNKIK